MMHFRIIFLLLISICVYFCIGENETESGSGNVLEESGSGSGDDLETVVKRSSPKEVTYPDILKESVDIITKKGTSQKQLRALLVKYYFTDQKSMSIWPKAIEETEKTFGVEFEERELFEMENNVKNIYRRILECELNNEKKENDKEFARCLLTLREYIDDGKVDFSLPRGTIEGEAKMIEMHMAYNIMSLIVLQFASKQAEKAKVPYYRAANYTLTIASSLLKTVKIVVKNTIEGRLQAISQPEICLMQQCLWQEFQVSCEFRSKRSISGKEVGVGGEGDIFVQRYRAKVIDNVSKQEICNLPLYANSTSEAKAVKTTLARQCGERRKIQEEKIKQEVTKFYDSRTTPILNNICKLWDCDDKKLKTMKSKFAV